MENQKTKSITKEDVARARKQVLDVIETAYGHTPQWVNVRSRLLKIFGRDGLEGLVNGCSAEHIFAEHGAGRPRRNNHRFFFTRAIKFSNLPRMQNHYGLSDHPKNGWNI